MTYVEVTLHLYEEDLVEGLLVKFVGVPGQGLVPFTWPDSPYNTPSQTERRVSLTYDHDTLIVDVEVYGGTQEQFLYGKAEHAAWCRQRGWEQGKYVHLPKAALKYARPE